MQSLRPVDREWVTHVHAVELVDVIDLATTAVSPLPARSRHCKEGVELCKVEDEVDDMWVVCVIDHDVEMLQHREKGMSVYVGYERRCDDAKGVMGGRCEFQSAAAEEDGCAP